MTREQAMEIAREAVASQGASVETVLLEDKTEEREFGWVFRFAPKKYLETHDPRHMVPGLGPVAVERETGASTFLATSVYPERAVAEFERRWRAERGSGFSLHFLAKRGAARRNATSTTDATDEAKAWQELACTASLGEALIEDADVQLYFPDPLRLVLTRAASDRLVGQRKDRGIGLTDRAFVATLGNQRLFAGESIFVGSARAIRHPVAYLDDRGDAAVIWIRGTHVGWYERPPSITGYPADLTADMRARLADHFRRSGRLFDIDAAHKAQPGFFAAIEILATAENLLATGDAAAADTKAHEGLSRLGSDYAPRGTDDDTGLKLAAAEDLRQRGQIQDAAGLAISMLRARIALYRVRHPDTPRETKWLSLRLTCDAYTVRVGEAVNAKVELANTGDEPLLVNGRMALNVAAAPSPLGQVFFEVKDSNERPRPFLPKLEVLPPRPEDVVELAPGATITRTWNLAEYYDLSALSSYWIRAHYASAPIADKQGRAAWSQPLMCGWLIVKVQP